MHTLQKRVRNNLRMGSWENNVLLRTTLVLGQHHLALELSPRVGFEGEYPEIQHLLSTILDLIKLHHLELLEPLSHLTKVAVICSGLIWWGLRPILQTPLTSSSRRKCFPMEWPTLDASLPPPTETLASWKLLDPANTFIVSSFLIRISASSESPSTPPIFKIKMKELGKMGKNVINLTCQNILVKLRKYYYKTEMGEKKMKEYNKTS